MQRQIEDMKDQYVQDIANLSSELNMKLSKDDLDTLESKLAFLIVDREPIRTD